MDPLGDVLYVANANTDSTFGGSTLVSVDLLRHEHAVSCFRRYGRGDGGDAECGRVSCDQSGWSLGSEATIEQTEAREAIDGKAPADYDRCYCQYDLDDPNVVNCESQRFIIADQTVKVGFFPGSMQILAEDPPNWSTLKSGDALRRGLYMAVRGDPSVTFIDVQRPLRPGRLATESPGLNVSCGDVGADAGPHEPGQPYVTRACADANRVQRTADEILIDVNNPSAGTQPRLSVPTEPMEIQIDRGCVEKGFRHDRGTFLTDAAQNPSHHPPCYKDDGMGGVTSGTYYQYLVASHLAHGEISAYDLGKSAISPVTPVMAPSGTVAVNSSGPPPCLPSSRRLQPWLRRSRRERRHTAGARAAGWS